MLQEELIASDIPHRTTMQARIIECLTEHLDGIQDELKVSFYKLPQVCLHLSDLHIE
jgi:hypothetical protein